MKLFTLAAVMLLALAPCAHAQIRPFYITKGRGAEGKAQSFERDFQYREREEEACKKLGCLVIMNTSINFNVIGFYLDTRKPDDEGPPRWGPNQFERIRLAPNQAVFTIKSGDGSMCGVLVRVVLAHRKTREKIDAVLGTFDLCTDPERTNSLLPIKVVEPQVILEDGE